MTVKQQNGKWAPDGAEYVTLTDGDGNLLSVGAGTQYTEGDTDASITGTAILWEGVGNVLTTVAAATPLPVTVISGGGAGTQYTEADTDASITGTALMWEDAADTLRAVSAAKPLPVGDAGGSLTVDGTFWQATQPVSIASLPALAAGTNNIGDVDVLTVPADPFGANADAASATGSISAKLRFIASTGIPITGTVTVGSHAVTNAGTFAVQVDGAALTSLQLLDDIVSGTEAQVDIVAPLPAGTNAIGKLAANSGVDIGDVDILSIAAGDNNIGNVDIVSGTITTVSTVTALTGGGIAHDSVDSGNPVKVGARAISTMSGGTNVAAADRTDLITDLDGALISRKHVVADRIKGTATNTDGASTQVIAAQAASVKINVTDVTLSNSSATNITVDLKDGSTVIWTFPVPATGGVTHSFQTPLTGTAATALNFDPSAAATTITCSVSGYISKV